MTNRLEISVIFESRGDGGLRVWSPDVPLFVLSGDDPKKVISDVIPALTVVLASLLEKECVEVTRLIPFSERDTIEPYKIPKGNQSYCVAA